MRKLVASGKTVEDAVQKGLSQLQLTADRVQVTVLEQPSRGWFGLIGAKDARVELEVIPDPAEEAERFLSEVARAMGVNVVIEHQRSRDGLVLALSGGDELGMMIGRRGQTLDALQYLANIVANRYTDSHFRLVLDAENFRERRRKTLEELADRLAGRVIRTRKEVVLEPMSAHERKVIHARLQHHDRVSTSSRGDEPHRRVVITLKA
ncbi:protein jag [Paenibacillus sp. 598K]|uniref:RNA-binding cell elongation regulator Jag/EloR n=1 Tax=Paenibacillus sp. 598K TaxID=1117987 RepID=UPI000FFAF341|nr:RNA-binding cell elongation regulator Jag/EloR [Paenibacillus sp. 598K]GBF73520.1 protein jag [Paenibacillus sp. 598K]